MICDITRNTELLSQVSSPISQGDVFDRVTTNLMDTANKAKVSPSGCAGLAAIQISEPYRVFVFWHENNFKLIINPDIVYIKGRKDVRREGCLSRPGVNAKVERFKKVQITHGLEDRVTEKYTGMAARIIQHEMDHLNGVYLK